LLAETFGVQHISFINPFFKHSLIKKRIIMLHKNRSKQLLKFKYLLLVPLLGGMLLYAACEKSDQEIKETSTAQELINELKAKAEGKELTEEELNAMLSVISTQLSEEDNVREKEIIEKLLHILAEQKRKKEGMVKVIEQDFSDAEEVPFAAIEKTPIFPNCENAEDSKLCFQESVQEYISKKFNTSLANGLGLEPGKKKVYVQFTIDKEGNITEVKARGPHQALEEEAIRVIDMLPKMTPGEHNGKKVGVTYTLPITLTVD
jgi:hypothetical protein